jgi:hypothetical protein
MSPNSDKRENPRGTRRPEESARGGGKASLFLKSAWRTGRLFFCGVLLQTSGCMFDSEAFIGDSLAAIFDNVATTLIITTLADLLGVAPTFGF